MRQMPGNGGVVNQSLTALAIPLSRLFKAQFWHTQFVVVTIWAQSDSMQHLVKAIQAALTKILPGEKDRFGK
jgi:hypothetical protein